MTVTLNDADAFRELATLINEEIDLYTDEDLMILADASMKLFIRSLLIAPMKLK